MQTNRRKTILLLSLLLTVLLCGCVVLVGVLMYLKASENTSLVAARPSPDTDAVVSSAAVDEEVTLPSAEVTLPSAEVESKEFKETIEDAGTTVEEVSDYTLIKKPVRSGNATTWDCIWFGNYWQEDTNGDGRCFERDTTVTKHEEDAVHGGEYYTDQDGKELYGFEGEEKTYYADAKQPIKWRVLDIDDNGNALLLADKLIDVVEYNETHTEVTWETCTLRSYLNGYGSTQNVCNRDFSGDNSFLYNAFSETERNNIITSDLTNQDNPYIGTKGGNATQDKIFCLSLDEARTADYGFIKNEFTNGYYTDKDPTRVAVTTKFTVGKPGYSGNTAGSSAWWLRSHGLYSHSASIVLNYGAAYADRRNVDSYSLCVRPAFRMNLSSSSSLWHYAGTVCSDGTVNEVK